MKTRMSIFLVTVMAIAACNSLTAPDKTQILRADPAINEIVPGNASLEIIDTSFQFTEGPVWDDEGSLLFSDIPANKIYRWKEGKGISVWLDSPGNSNGLTFDNEGNFVFCSHGRRSVVQLNKDGSLTDLVNTYEGKKLNSPNDLVINSKGVIYFTDPCWGLNGLENSADKEVRFNGVYRLEGNELSVVDSTLWRPNGIALSPDQRTLYIADMFNNKTTDISVLYRYTLDEKGYPVSRDIIILRDPKDEILGEEGGFDGIKTDLRGNIYCTGPHGIIIISPDGIYLGTVTTPEMPANCAWGDNDYKTLYITARKHLYRIALDSEGFSPQRK